MTESKISRGGLGTDWCAPGSGATVDELRSLLRARGAINEPDSDRYLYALEALPGAYAYARTALRVTGRIQPYDCQRIRAAIAAVAS